MCADVRTVHCVEPVPPLFFRHLQRMHAAGQPLHLRSAAKTGYHQNRLTSSCPRFAVLHAEREAVLLFSYGIDILHSHQSLAQKVRAVGGQHHVALDHR